MFIYFKTYEMDDFKNHINPLIIKFKRARQTRFANANHVNIEDVHVHNQIPVWYLVKLFKSQNNIKSRLFKSLSEEQKNNWLTFYDQNKKLVLTTNENHELFHKNNIFDTKTETWKTVESVQEKQELVSKPQEEIPKKRIRVKKECRKK